MSHYDYFVIVVGVVSGSILGAVALFDLIEDLKDGKKGGKR